jgi:Domain of unknown function (DUF1707)
MTKPRRAGDRDRERAAALLRGHLTAGRLTPGEFDDRLAAARSAVTCQDLDEILAGLPEPATVRPQAKPLERRYRRLLALYPAWYRRVHEDEMLDVLMTDAAEDKTRPGLREAADLIAACLRIWCQPSRSHGWHGVAVLACAGATAGIVGGITVAAVTPPVSASNTIIVFPGLHPYTRAAAHARSIRQAAIVHSQPVLAQASDAINPSASWQDLRSHVHTTWLTPALLQISVSAETGIQAERAANAVARSFLAYTSSNGSDPADPELLEPATNANRPSVLAHIISSTGAGALSGAVLGVIIAIGLSRPRQRFRIT